jgi:hypothetical protein
MDNDEKHFLKPVTKTKKCMILGIFFRTIF